MDYENIFDALAPACESDDSYGGEDEFDDEFDGTDDLWCKSLESYMDYLGYEELSYAMEFCGAETAYDIVTEAKGSRFRAFLGRFKKSKNEGNDSEAKNAIDGAEDTLNEIEQEANSDDIETLKKSNRELKIAAAATAVLAGAILGHTLGKSALNFKDWYDRRKIDLEMHPEQKHSNIFKEIRQILLNAKTEKKRFALNTAIRSAEFHAGNKDENMDKHMSKLNTNMLDYLLTLVKANPTSTRAIHAAYHYNHPAMVKAVRKAGGGAALDELEKKGVKRDVGQFYRQLTNQKI